MITRQEVASMIPAALLNVQHDDLVLDLCAAPGSKTLQALDSLYRSWHAASASSSPLTHTPAPLPGLISLCCSLCRPLSLFLSPRARAQTHTHGMCKGIEGEQLQTECKLGPSVTQLGPVLGS